METINIGNKAEKETRYRIVLQRLDYSEKDRDFKINKSFTIKINDYENKLTFESLKNKLAELGLK